LAHWFLYLLTNGMCESGRALLLIAGALGAFVATWSGNQAKETIRELPQAAENLLDRHEELAETTRNFAIAAGIVAL
jgi:hypothetical protein